MGQPVPYFLLSNVLDRLLLSAIGVVISVYSLHVEIEKERNPSFRAACDFSEKMSCSKVLTSSYARGFGVVGKLFGSDSLLNARNCNLGIIFYLAYPVVDLFLRPSLAAPVLLLMSVSGILTSVYLAFILFFVLRDFCLVCVTTYFINGCLLYLNYSFYMGLRV
uniref:vitamin-K-epoxide reductase (warfarin-sensitive) n=1 Tax=Conus ebraeus TaxID=89425 RepID=A0A218NGK8_CONEA|nr:vitamin K epoxide reductase complex subunit 1 [Conus ebraeus]